MIQVQFGSCIKYMSGWQSGLGICLVMIRWLVFCEFDFHQSKLFTSQTIISHSLGTTHTGQSVNTLHFLEQEKNLLTLSGFIAQHHANASVSQQHPVRQYLIMQGTVCQCALQ